MNDTKDHMARISPIPADQWPEEMAPFTRGPLTEIDQDVLGIQAHLPATTKAFYKTKAALGEEGTLPPRLHELIRLRIAFFNQCRSCMAVRLNPDVTEDLVCSLERPMDADDLTDTEKAALAYVELLATDHLAITDDTYTELRTHFNDQQLVELGTAAALSIGMGRLAATWHVTDHLAERYKHDGPVSPW